MRSPIILILEWDDEISGPLRSAFVEAGFDVIIAETSTDALVLIGREAPDIVVLRWDLTAADPVSFVKSVVRVGMMPVIAVGPSLDTDDEVELFAAGATAFVRRPVDPPVIVARAQALLRLTGPRLDSGSTVIDASRELVYDGAAGRVRLGEGVVHLTATEFAVLGELVADAGRVISRSELVHRVRPDSPRYNPRLVDAHISRLRAKLEVDASAPALLHTVHGRGYRLDMV